MHIDLKEIWAEHYFFVSNQNNIYNLWFFSVDGGLITTTNCEIDKVLGI